MNAVGLALAITLVPTLSTANDPRAQRGRTFALANCAQCHAVGPIGESPLRIAPPFRNFTRAIPSIPSPRRWPRASSRGIPRCPSSVLTWRRLTI